MTGFATARFETPSARYLFEIKSYNSKYLDASVKVPRSYMMWEGEILKLIKGRVERGRIEAFLTAEPSPDAVLEFHLNEGVLHSFYSALQRVKSRYLIKEPIELRDLLSLREVMSVQTRDLNLTAEWEAICPSLLGACDQLIQMRSTEGKFLKEKMVGFLEELLRLLDRIRIAHQETSAELRRRFEERIREHLSQIKELDHWKLEQEVVYYIHRSDIAEELARFESHLHQLRTLFGTSSAIGRKLEFLVQELGREINTMGAKSQGTELSRLVVEGKDLLDKLREQSMNIE